MDLHHIAQEHAFARLAFEFHRQIIEAKHHVLRRHDDRLAVRGAEDVVVDIISTRASSCASRLSGTWTAIWSPSKSALKAEHPRSEEHTSDPQLMRNSYA